MPLELSLAHNHLSLVLPRKRNSMGCACVSEQTHLSRVCLLSECWADAACCCTAASSRDGCCEPAPCGVPAVAQAAAAAADRVFWVTAAGGAIAAAAAATDAGDCSLSVVYRQYVMQLVLRKQLGWLAAIN